MLRGMHDIIKDEQLKFNKIVKQAKTSAYKYNFEEWITPILEETSLFQRAASGSTAVNKEMYTFLDRNNESVSLRPEGTAGICRALVSNKLTQARPQKVFYYGPMFRYERPQKGRYRQFHQIGVEMLGVPATNPISDAEVISYGVNVLSSLNINYTLEINYIGTPSTRALYTERLTSYFSDKKGKLSKESQQTSNVFRILDSKRPEDIEICKNCPLILDDASEQEKNIYSAVKDMLAAYEIPFVENPNLVRGLDYYDHTVFEFKSKEIGAQNTLMAGGRYSSLVNAISGNNSIDIEGVGLAAGVERLMLLIKKVERPDVISVLIKDNSVLSQAINIIRCMREDYFSVDVYPGNDYEKFMKHCERNFSMASLVINSKGATLTDLLNKTKIEFNSLDTNRIVDALDGL